MENSQLVQILKRLDVMIKSADNETQVRRFEKDGQERCVVSYNPGENTFSLEEVQSKQKFDFDNIDLVAIEIFDLLDD